MTFIPSVPWFTPAAHHVKLIGHQLECMRRKIDLALHILAYKDHVLQYKQALKKTKTDYFTSGNSNDQGNPEAVFASFISQNSVVNF